MIEGKLVSDGLPHGGTHLYSGDGTEIKGITAVKWVHPGVDQIPYIEASLGLYHIEVAGKLGFYLEHPEKGEMVEITRVVFADGSEWVAA